ncbi:S1 RNA-binding domain-containing protein [Thermoactinospora rubra]|uniref:S1 RNA-binding domain-containing protein n=1 Tax=Thermoactinospora rubra TaxID=1088767 RepID=UPI00117D86C5|nr:S1 RNA-binding domain-containing protein [Thermoactinospora rubra]
MSSMEHEVPLPAWTEFVSRHSAGGTLRGRVTQVMPFGAFVEVADGIQGLLPQSAWAGRPEPGAEISVKIAVLDLDRRRMSLSQV